MVHGTFNFPGEATYKEEEQMALAGLDSLRVAGWLAGAPAKLGQEALWAK